MNSVDPRRKEKVNRYKANGAVATDDLPDYMNILGKCFIAFHFSSNCKLTFLLG